MSEVIPVHQQFGVGDVVTLRSGSTRMTVRAVWPIEGNKGQIVVCTWFDGVRVIERHFEGFILARESEVDGAAI